MLHYWKRERAKRIEPIALQFQWHPCQQNFLSWNNCHMFFCSYQCQIFHQNARAEEDADNQHHFHNNWPETVKIVIHNTSDKDSQENNGSNCNKCKQRFISYTIRRRFSVFVSSTLPEFATLIRLYPGVNGLCSATPWVIICLTRICNRMGNEYANIKRDAIIGISKFPNGNHHPSQQRVRRNWQDAPVWLE